MRHRRDLADGLMKFEDVLGPSAGRYFGSGFRRVKYVPRYETVSDDNEVQVVGGVCEVGYPDDWSLDTAGVPRALHLSSIDALIICSGAVDHAYLRWRDLQHAAMSIERLTIRAGARPVTLLNAVPMTVKVVRTGGARLNVTASVGGFTVTAEIAVDADSHSREVGISPWIVNPEGAELSGFVYDVDVGRREVTTLHMHQGDGGADHDGHLAVPGAALTYVDNIVLFGQVAQVLVQLTEGIARGSIENLWMRRLEFVQRHAACPSQFRVRARIVRHDVIERAGNALHSLAMAATSEHGVDADAVFGFARPVEVRFA